MVTLAGYKIKSPGFVRALGIEKYKNSFVVLFEDIGEEAILPEVEKLFGLTKMKDNFEIFGAIQREKIEEKTFCFGEKRFPDSRFFL